MRQAGRRAKEGSRIERVLGALERAQALSSTLPAPEAFSASTVSAVWESYSQCEYAIGLLRLELPEEALPLVPRKRAKDSDLPEALKQVPMHLQAATAALGDGDKVGALALARQARDALRSLLLASRKRMG